MIHHCMRTKPKFWNRNFVCRLNILHSEIDNYPISTRFDVSLDFEVISNPITLVFTCNSFSIDTITTPPFPVHLISISLIQTKFKELVNTFHTIINKYRRYVYAFWTLHGTVEWDGGFKSVETESVNFRIFFCLLTKRHASF